MTKSRPRNRSRSASVSRAPAPPSGQVWLWGQHAVEAALANPKRRLKRLIATRNAASRLSSISKRAEIVEAPALDAQLPQGAVHQGIAGLFAELEPVALETLIDGETPRIAVLDQLSDPHNLGAIFRSAAAFGVKALVLQTRHTPPITGVAAKSAAGGIEHVAECRVVNIARSLDTLADAGYHTIGLAAGGARDLSETVQNAPKLALVLGAEGAGLRPGVAKACLEQAHIRMEPGMESLNVSNAAAIAFYEAFKAKP